jgi:hypothetical protein
MTPQQHDSGASSDLLAERTEHDPTIGELLADLARVTGRLAEIMDPATSARAEL